MPRVYLGQFGKRRFVFDKLKGTTFEATSKNVAVEKGFYDLDPSIDFEAHLAKQESNLLQACENSSPGETPLQTRERPGRRSPCTSRYNTCELGRTET